jgi:hypothetical protein
MTYRFLNTTLHLAEPCCTRTAKTHARQVLHIDVPTYGFWSL